MIKQLFIFNKRIILVLFVVVCHIHVDAQNDTLHSQHSKQDSIKVVVPKQGLANLKMLTPPEGFVVADKFNGYIHYQASAAIIMTMLENVSFIDIDKGMTNEFFQKNQLVFIEKKDMVSASGTKGLIYKFSFVLSGKEFIRYFVYAGDLNKTLWLAITYPRQYDALLDANILQCTQTITLNP
ncbi:MAG TPA: hypothetical protein VK177_21665 [Flavobacteriales bacterium]|nr:hypothetical protein [Flavobacteriales bacterium]